MSGKITNAGLAEMAKLGVDSGSPTEFTYLAYGSDDTDAAVTDTTLGTETDREAATVSTETTSVTDDTMRWTKTFSISGATTVKEVGIFNAAADGDMLARYILGTARSLSDGDSYVVTFDIPLSS